jgi:hypothetical protein
VSGVSSVDLFGRSIGMFGVSATGRIVGSSTMRSVWAADSVIACRVSRGVGRPVYSGVSVMGQAGSLSAGVSYAAPSLSSVRSTNTASTGGSSVIVTGRGVGSAGYSTGYVVGFTSCEVSRWVAESSVVCKLSGSAEPVVAVSCSAGLQVSGALSAALSYNVAAVWYASPGNAGSSGSSRLTVIGALFGTWDRSSKVRVHNTAAAGTGWVADSGLVCRARHGLGWLLRAYVSAGVQRGSVSAAVSYDAPVVSSAGVSNVASSGAMSVSVSGRGMGVSGYSAAGRAGGSLCGASVWRSDSGLVCRTAAGSGRAQTLLASAGLQRGWLSEAVSYDVLFVNAVSSGLF